MVFLWLCFLLLVHGSEYHDSCSYGAYKTNGKGLNNGCSGWMNCEPGYYCENGIKYICPNGYYGNSPKLTNNTCSGLCPQGYYCPHGTIDPFSYKCGNSSVYCPLGSSQPLNVPLGYYTLGDDIETRYDILICPKGYYCVNGIKQACPGGTYGDSEGLSTENCTGLCDSAYYCGLASITPKQNICGTNPNFYCPKGSDHPLPVALGYYADKWVNDIGYMSQKICDRGAYCINGVKTLCPAGRYGADVQSIDPLCSGICMAGYWCPEGSIKSTQEKCGLISSFCPEGSAKPNTVSQGYYTVATTIQNVTLLLYPIINETSKSNLTSLDLLERELSLELQADQNLCEPGYYCTGDGIRRPCRAGRYGRTYGLTSSDCSGICSEGYYCPEASITSTQFKCGGPSVFCPPGSALPQQVYEGYYSVDNVDNEVRTHERRCEPGFFCDGNGTKALCRKGYFGDGFGNTEGTCSGECSPGYYCPSGSVSSTEVMCGNTNLYCPGYGNYQPTLVSKGYYTIGLNESTRTDQIIAPKGSYAINGVLYKCSAGRYGATEGLSSSSCSGACNINGYYCPSGSISPTQYICGNDNVICPAPSGAPITVNMGFYTAYYRDTFSADVCPIGYYRNWSLALDSTLLPDSSVAQDTTIYPLVSELLLSCQLCPNGTYKYEMGDDPNLCLPCNVTYASSIPTRATCDCFKIQASDSNLINHFNILDGSCSTYDVDELQYIDASEWNSNTSVTRYKEYSCEAGYFCKKGIKYICPSGYYGSLTRETRNLCEGLCSAGYFCPPGSTSPFQYACGTPSRICPEGSGIPIIVPSGNYSDENESKLLRTTQYSCPPGYYCPGDGNRYKCPPGRYGDSYGLTTSECSGLCSHGYYCKEGSSSSQEYKCGNATVYCPTGSSSPSLAHAGFYTINTGINAREQSLWDKSNSTRSAEIPCDPGWYCENGIKYPCPPGTFAWRYGLTSIQSCTKCAAGYYCPSYLEPQPDAPSHTVWPGRPHTQAAEYECGGVGFFCPAGSFYPKSVGSGNYTFGGDATNNTRRGQERCEPGSFCQNGIALLCPKGKYGGTFGLTDPVCTGWCTPGHYCPEGTAVPIPCPHNSYALSAAWQCSLCPADRDTELTCNNARSCCFIE